MLPFVHGIGPVHDPRGKHELARPEVVRPVLAALAAARRVGHPGICC